MFDTQRIRQDFSEAAPRYERHAALQQRVLSRLRERTRNLLHPPALILDAGCGTGALARRLAGHKVIQLDIAHAMCARAATPENPAINARAEALPFADGTFDAVFSSLMLQWTDAKAPLGEMQRVLKPGGFMAFTTFTQGTLAELAQSFACIDSYPHVTDFITADELLQLCHPREGGGLGKDSRLRGKDDSAYEETITEYYPDAMTLMRHLQSIGARNKLAGQRKSLMTPSQLQKIESYYRKHFGSPDGLRVTWNVFYGAVHTP